MVEEHTHHSASYSHRVSRSILDSFSHPKEFFASWFFDALHFVVVVVAFVLFSNSMSSSLQQLVSVNDLVVSGSVDSIGLANSAMKLFIVKAVLLVLSLLVLYLFSYSFSKKFSLQFVSHKRVSFGRFFWLNAIWTTFWVVVGAFHIYLLIPALVPLVQFLYSLSSILGMFVYYSLFFLPMCVYLHCTTFLHFSFVEHHSIVGAYKGMFGSILKLHKLLPSYVLAGIIIFLLSYIIPFLEGSSQSLQWALVLVLIISPWLSCEHDSVKYSSCV